MEIGPRNRILVKLQKKTCAVPPFLVPARGPRQRLGAVIWSSDGTVITNAHVCRAGATHHQPSAFGDGREFSKLRVRVTRSATGTLQPFTSTRNESPFRLPSARLIEGAPGRNLPLPSAIPLGFSSAPLTTGVDHRGFGPIRGLGSQSWVQAECPTWRRAIPVGPACRRPAGPA